MSDFKARVVGIPYIPSVREVSVRQAPSNSAVQSFTVRTGIDDLTIHDVQDDQQQRGFLGHVYQWFQCDFADGRGWIRDDMIAISGDGTAFGYPVLTVSNVAFNLKRDGASDDVIDLPPPDDDNTPPVEPPPPETRPAQVVCMAKAGVRIRGGAGRDHRHLTTLPYQATAKILGHEQHGNVVWVSIDYQGTIGWVQEDYVRYTGDFGTIGLSHPDLYPNPVPRGWWVRDFDRDGSRIGIKHKGWDIGGNKGFSIVAGLNGGEVIDVRFCDKCGTEGVSVVEKNIPLSASHIFTDDGWNFGYGHFIIVRYDHEQLPQVARDTLATRGFTGGHIFVMYAHLQDMLVREGNTVTAAQKIGTLGNSGNSSGPHLHLEIRASRNRDETRWARMKVGLMTPQVLFLR